MTVTIMTTSRMIGLAISTKFKTESRHPAYRHILSDTFQMTRTKVFQSNRSQAVRLANDVAFPADVSEVRILRDRATRVIAPADGIWDDFFAAPGVDLPAREQLEHVRA